MKKRLRASLLVSNVLLIGSGANCRQEPASPQMPPRVKQVLQWIPADTETLIVANGPFPIPRKLTDESPFLELARSLACGIVTGLQRDLPQEHLQGHNVLLAVEASRRFTSPKGLGVMPFEGCEILLFDHPAEGSLQAAIDAALAKAPKTIQLGDTKAAVFVEKWEEDAWSLFVVQPRREMLLCATNQKFLEEVLARVKEQHPERAFPDNLPEWEHVNFTASVWGLRHYRKDVAQTDPSSPLGPPVAANVPDSEAVGVVFWYDAQVPQVAKARYLTAAKHATGIVREGWHHPDDNLTPTIQVIKPGVVEISATVAEGNGGGQMFLLVLLGYLGHAVYL